jgi:hypothetical protein
MLPARCPTPLAKVVLNNFGAKLFIARYLLAMSFQAFANENEILDPGRSMMRPGDQNLTAPGFCD